jgi:hypothetical protein
MVLYTIGVDCSCTINNPSGAKEATIANHASSLRVIHKIQVQITKQYKNQYVLSPAIAM